MHMQYICSVHAVHMQVWGSPWQPEFCGWAFNLRRGEACAAKWRLIPPATDVLVTLPLTLTLPLPLTLTLTLTLTLPRSEQHVGLLSAVLGRLYRDPP